MLFLNFIEYKNSFVEFLTFISNAENSLHLGDHPAKKASWPNPGPPA